MNSLEKSILKNLKITLVESAKVTFKDGYLDEWVDFANKMKTTINNSVSIMDALLNEPTEKEPISEQPESDKPDKN